MKRPDLKNPQTTVVSQKAQWLHEGRDGKLLGNPFAL